MSNALTRLLFETPLGPRHMTLAEIFGRKAAKKGIQELVVDQDDKKAEFHPVLGKLAFYHHLAKMASIDKEAPFKSEAQRRKFYAMQSRGEISKDEVEKWESETPDKKLPERLHKKESSVVDKLPFLGLVPGKSLASRAARGVGGAAFLGLPVAYGMAREPVTPKIAAEADRLIGLLGKGAASNPGKAWLGRSTTGAPKLVTGQNPVQEMSGASAEERTTSSGQGPHIQRGS